MAVEEDPLAACIIFPTVNINCEWDQCDPSTHAKLSALASWKGQGRNHIIWDFNDGQDVKYRTVRGRVRVGDQ